MIISPVPQPPAPLPGATFPIELVASNPSGAGPDAVASPPNWFQFNYTTGALWGCINGEWTQLNTGGGGTPAGADGQIQFNNAGAFGASADFYRDTTTGEVDITAHGNVFALAATVKAAADGDEPYGALFTVDVNGKALTSQLVVVDIGSVTLSGGTLAAAAYGLVVEDQTAGTDNWAIKTGLGLVEFGDAVVIGSGDNNITGLQVDTGGAAGLGVDIRTTGSGPVALQAHAYASSNQSSAATIVASVTAQTGFTLTDGIAVSIDDLNGGGTLVNKYGVKIADLVSGTNNWAIKTGLGTNYFGDVVIVHRNTAPADGLLAAGDLAFWLDDTNGATKAMFKAKQADGTVRTGSVALS